MIFHFPRDNKLGLDLEEHIEEVHTFMPVRTQPLPELQIRAVAMGTSHAAVVTGKWLKLSNL